MKEWGMIHKIKAFYDNGDGSSFVQLHRRAKVI